MSSINYGVNLYLIKKFKIALQICVLGDGSVQMLHDQSPTRIDAALD